MIASNSDDDKNLATAESGELSVSLIKSTRKDSMKGRVDTSVSAIWNMPTVDGQMPSPRVGGTLTHIPSKNIAILFGGASHEDGFSNDLFSLNLENWKWTKIEPASNDKPSPRYEHSAVLVHKKDEEAIEERSEFLLVFGGAAESSLLNDIWLFSIRKNTWTSVKCAGKTPSARTLHSCGHVSGAKLSKNGTPESDRVYVFGGGGVSDGAVPDCAVYCLIVDSMLWIQLTPNEPSPQAPLPRLGHTIITIPPTTPDLSPRLVIFGGATATHGETYETWIFDVATRRWTSISSPVSPSQRFGHTANFMEGGEGSNKMILFGGMVKQGQPRVLDDVWSFDTDALCWSPLSAAGTPPLGSPSGRLDCATCIVPGRTQTSAKLLVFGGMDFAGVFNEVLELSLI